MPRAALSLPVAAALLLASFVARAQEAPAPPPAPPPSSDATQVLRPPPPTPPPPPSTLRIAVACADDPFVTPADGLTVSVDGDAPIASQGADAQTFTGTTSHGYLFSYSVVTDFAYAVPPGAHRLQVSAPGCDATTAPIEIPPGIPLVLDGRLRSDSSRRGPVDAPNGYVLSLSAFTSTVPEVINGGLTNQPSGAAFGTYSLSAGMPLGVLLSSGYERRFFTFRAQAGLGVSSYAGAVIPSGSLGTIYLMTGTMLVIPAELRVGVRLPLRYVAPAIGTGIGLQAWLPGNPTYGPLAPPEPLPGWTPSPSAQVYGEIPLWASIEVKPFCNFGLELGGSLDIGMVSESFTGMLHAGLLYQPAAACSADSFLKVAGH